jgi:hypothetical protein
MYKLVTIEDKEFVVPEWITDFGGFNHMPRPFEEVTWHDFNHIMCIESPTHMEHRQVRNEIDGQGCNSIKIFWFHNCAFAMRMANSWRCGKEGEPNIFFTEETRYFKIGCQHDYIEQGGTPMFFHTFKCSKCGNFMSYDSSD